MHHMNKNLAVTLAIILGLALIAIVALSLNRETGSARTFAECAAEGNPVMESYPRQCRFPDGTLVVEVIESASSSASSSSQANIVVTQPVANDEIRNPVIIRGQARVFENTFSYRIIDAADGTILLEDHAMASAPDIGQFGIFEVKATYNLPQSVIGTIEVFEYSAKDGSEINMVRIPVFFKEEDLATPKNLF